MTETKFDRILDLAEEYEPPRGLETYFPSVDIINEALETATVEDLLPVLAYIAGNPLREDEETARRADYKDAVRLSKQLVASVIIAG